MPKSVLSFTTFIIMTNAFIDPVTLTFYLPTPKPCHFYDIQRSFPIPNLNTLGLLFFELCCRETDRETDKQTNRQTNKQMALNGWVTRLYMKTILLCEKTHGIDIPPSQYLTKLWTRSIVSRFF